MDHYYCYMGAGPEYNHEKYININAAVNTVLEEPASLSAQGIPSAGGFYFDDVPATGTKTYLKDVLTGTQSLASYAEGYVYLNHVGDAFLLHMDENGPCTTTRSRLVIASVMPTVPPLSSRTCSFTRPWTPKGRRQCRGVPSGGEGWAGWETSFTPKDESNPNRQQEYHHHRRHGVLHPGHGGTGRFVYRQHLHADGLGILHGWQWDEMAARPGNH